MDNKSQLALREEYIRISRKLLNAKEEQRDESEVKKLQEQLESLLPRLTEIRECNSPDCP